MLQKLLFLIGFVVLAKGFPDDYIFSKFVTNPDEEYNDIRGGNLKILGGTAVTIDSRPFQVQIRVFNNTLICSGSILSSRWIITAAHCVYGNTPDLVIIRTNCSTLDSGGTLYNVSQIVTHALYNTSTRDYDFSLLYTSSPIIFGFGVNYTTIPPHGEGLPIFGSIDVSGWGYLTSISGTYSTSLQQVQLPMIPFTLCNIIYTGTLTNRMFCSGKLIIVLKGVCNGDDGGPATFNGILVGIVTKNTYCGNPIFPTIFSQVSYVTSWIVGITGIIY